MWGGGHFPINTRNKQHLFHALEDTIADSFFPAPLHFVFLQTENKSRLWITTASVSLGAEQDGIDNLETNPVQLR